MPTITFRFAMEANVQNFRVPSNLAPSTFVSRNADTVSSWLPDLYHANYKKKDDDEIEVEGAAAIYLRNLVNTGQVDFLEIVSTVP